MSETETTNRESFGPYSLLRELGRGGQAVVYLAEDNRLHREVALKILHAAGDRLGDDQLKRFQREAEATSRLDHPNICAIYEAGDVDGTPYIAMRYVEGETLAGRIARLQGARGSGPSTPVVTNAPGTDVTSDPKSRTGLAQTIRLVEKIARALHRAHEQGLIHRDIKPGNIMITADGDPVVLDFGLARLELEDDQSLTQSGDLLGTPAYMSPEQLLAQRIPIDRRTDVYSLGATLYECLTLQRPFHAATRAQLYERILNSEPTRVSSLNRQIPRDLQIVVETAIEKDRSRRYQTALDLADDLRRVREFEPVRARPIGRLLRVRRWSQRHPVVATVLAATFLLLAVGLIGSLAFIQQQEAQLRRTKALALASASREAAPTNPKLALRLALAAVAMDSKRETLSQLQAALAVQHERAVVQIGRGAWAPRKFDVSPDGYKFVASNSMGTAIRMFDTSGQKIRSFEGHTAISSSATFSPDGKQILSCSDDRTARLWDLHGEVLHVLEGHGDEVWHGAFSPDYDQGKNEGVILTTSKDKTARLWSPRGDSLWEFRGHEGPVVSPAFSPRYAEDGRFLTTSRDGTLKVWHRDGRVLLELDDDLGGNPIAVFSPRGDRILTVGVEGVGYAQLWDLQGTRLWRFGGPGIGNSGASFSRDGDRIVTTHFDQTVRIWDADGRPLTVIPGPSAPRPAAWSSDRTRLVVPYHDQIVRLYDEQGFEIAQFAGHGSRVRWARFVADGRVILSGSEDGTVRLWDVQSPDFPVFRGHTLAIQKVRFSRDGNELMSAGEDGRVLLWELRTGRKKEFVPRHDNTVWTAEYSPHGDVILTASGDGTVRLSGRDGRKIREFRHPAAPHGASASFSPDATRILTCWIVDRSVRLLDRTLTELRRLEVQGGNAVFSPRFREDGLIASVNLDDTARLWYRDGTAGPKLPHDKLVGSVVFSGDATRVLTASYDGTVRMWNLAGEELWKFTGHQGPVHAAEFSPTDDLIVTASRDKTVRILDLDGKEKLTIRSPHGFFSHAVFSPDGQRVATAAAGVVRIFHVYAEDLLRLAEGRGGEFTMEELERFKDLLPKSAVAPRRNR